MRPAGADVTSTCEAGSMPTTAMECFTCAKSAASSTPAMVEQPLADRYEKSSRLSGMRSSFRSSAVAPLHICMRPTAPTSASTRFSSGASPLLSSFVTLHDKKKKALTKDQLDMPQQRAPEVSNSYLMMHSMYASWRR